MNETMNDELISAYLDGELSGQEQSQFEERISQDSKLREAIEELRALRDKLQSLPKHQLESDFAQRVLQRARIEKSANDKNKKQQTTEKIAITTPPKETDHRAGRLRGMLFSALTVAAAVLLIVFYKNSPDDLPANHSLLSHKTPKSGDSFIGSAEESGSQNERGKSLHAGNTNSYLGLESMEDLNLLFNDSHLESAENAAKTKTTQAKESKDNLNSSITSDRVRQLAKIIRSQIATKGSADNPTLVAFYNVSPDTFTSTGSKFSSVLKKQQIAVYEAAQTTGRANIKASEYDKTTIEKEKHRTAHTKNLNQRKKPVAGKRRNNSTPLHDANKNKAKQKKHDGFDQFGGTTTKSAGAAADGDRGSLPVDQKYHFYYVNTTVDQLDETLKAISRQSKNFELVELTDSMSVRKKVQQNRKSSQRWSRYRSSKVKPTNKNRAASTQSKSGPQAPASDYKSDGKESHERIRGLKSGQQNKLDGVPLTKDDALKGLALPEEKSENSKNGKKKSANPLRKESTGKQSDTKAVNADPKTTVKSKSSAKPFGVDANSETRLTHKKIDKKNLEKNNKPADDSEESDSLIMTRGQAWRIPIDQFLGLEIPAREIEDQEDFSDKDDLSNNTVTEKYIAPQKNQSDIITPKKNEKSLEDSPAKFSNSAPQKPPVQSAITAPKNLDVKPRSATNNAQKDGKIKQGKRVATDSLNKQSQAKQKRINIIFVFRVVPNSQLPKQAPASK